MLIKGIKEVCQSTYKVYMVNNIIMNKIKKFHYK